MEKNKEKELIDKTAELLASVIYNRWVSVISDWSDENIKDNNEEDV